MSEKERPAGFVDLFDDDLRPMQYWHDLLDAKIQQWRTGEKEGFSTGFPKLDDYARLYPGEMMLVAARPSMGKTQLALQMAVSVAKDLQRIGDGVVAFFSAEMPGETVYGRLAQMETGISMQRLRNGEGSSAEYDQFADAARTARTLPLWMDDASGPSTANILAQLEELHRSNPVKLLLFDFAELANAGGRTQEERVSRIAEAFKAIAKRLHIPVVVLSQLNREVEKRANRQPQLSDLRASGMLEQLADQVVFIMRPEYYIERGMEVSDLLEQTDAQGVAYVSVAKNRNGPVGATRLAWLSEKAMFATLAREKVPLND